MNTPATDREHTFEKDVDFLAHYQDVRVLQNAGEAAKVALVPAYQGRVMTSTAGGGDGHSYGWINYEHVASGKLTPRINAFGGEDRFWLGPEGGQFAIFFKPGAPFDIDHWQTPPLIDAVPYEIKIQSATSITFTRQDHVQNYSGFSFELEIERTINLLDGRAVAPELGLPPDHGLDMVAFESVNTLTNTGNRPWRHDTGLLSIWTLGMFKPGRRAVVILPLRPAQGNGPRIVDNYFGKVPADRLSIKDHAAFFKADGRYRSKIGVPAPYATPFAGSYDADKRLLTLVRYTLPEGQEDYVNSLWEIQDRPFAGDTINAYNDGPASPGAKPLGPFYELETSSPALDLQPGQSATHVHRTVHVQGNDDKAMEKLAGTTLGTGPAELTQPFAD